MKKKYLIIIIALIILLIGGIIWFIYKNTGNYIVKVNSVDEKSPDRVLTVYKEDEKIEYKEIRKMNDVLLCDSNNPSVYYGEIKNESKLKIVLNNDKKVVAKVVKGE